MNDEYVMSTESSQINGHNATLSQVSSFYLISELFLGAIFYNCLNNSIKEGISAFQELTYVRRFCMFRISRNQRVTPGSSLRKVLLRSQAEGPA